MALIISATNRPNSNTRKIAAYYQQELREKGMETSILDLQDIPGNILATDLYGARSDAFRPFQELVTSAEKFLFVIPEYNGSFPGVLKAFIDACDFPQSFSDKKAALVGISSGKYGNIRGIDHFTGVCNYLQMHVLPLKIHISQIRTELDENNRLYKEDTVKFTNVQMDKFVSF